MLLTSLLAAIHGVETCPFKRHSLEFGMNEICYIIKSDNSVEDTSSNYTDTSLNRGRSIASENDDKMNMFVPFSWQSKTRRFRVDTDVG